MACGFQIATDLSITPCRTPFASHVLAARDGFCRRSLMLREKVRRPGDQLHFELLASTKLLTELTTLDAVLATVAIWLAEGFAWSALTALVSASTEDLMALV